MREVLEARMREWLDDPESNVSYAEEVEGRWAVRMSQETRDATTVWFDVGERSLQFEAYVLPTPPQPLEVFRQALFRNAGSWRAFFSLDSEGAIVLRGRLTESQVTHEELDLALGEIYLMVDLAFRAMVRAGFGDRERSG